ncbi:elongation of very long chain fatty acids protein 4 [Aplysia californica]|uniref:Elongation of very long chain fatty acids protein n=1 Tax=Aplysia californica TaxID=6500 RepID=A0ABM0ZXC0_APLCA|nr:elongation of very long chain fatty acids protein 4 [Aplysia californica]
MDVIRKYYSATMRKADDRVADWFLMDSPLPTIAVVALYLVFVIQGQTWMRDRKAFDLKPLLVLYNFGLVLLSVYMVIELILSSWTVPEFSLTCQAMDYSDNPYSVRLAKVCWWFYFSKIVELMDTVFFVLRKKNNQISFLHVYHHTTMPLLWWVGVKFVPGGEAFFSSTINSGIHVLMYLYYMLSAMGPAMQPYLWWKKYMTTLQLIQFWTVMFKTCYAIYVHCDFPVEYGYALVAYTMSHIVLFSNFYYHTYLLQARRKKDDGPNAGSSITKEGNNSNSNKQANGVEAVRNGSAEKVQIRKQRRFD